MTTRSPRLLAAASATLLALTGCAGTGVGDLGNILGGVLNPAGTGSQQGEAVVEVQSVDTRQQAIHVRTDRGESGTVLYDGSTVVVYQQQQYPVTALERGDIVEMQLQQLDRNRLYTPRIDVRQSVQERNGGSVGGVVGQMQRVSGTVAQIDYQRNVFELRTGQGTYLVVLPADADRSTVDHFNRLRQGHSVSVEGTMAGSGRIDLYRFL